MRLNLLIWRVRDVFVTNVQIMLPPLSMDRSTLYSDSKLNRPNKEQDSARSIR
jgi:hypothetical protein